MISRPSGLKAKLAAVAVALSGCGAAPDPEVTRSGMTPPLGEILSIDGRQTHVWDSGGPGPVVVLLHGASGNLRDHTLSLAPRLERRYRVIAFDRPGLGYSDGLNNSGESPRQQAAHMAKVLDLKGVDEAVIVGHSFGGAVAMAWALERPDQVAAVVSLSGATMPWPGGLGAWYGIASSGVGGATVVPLLVALTPESTADVIVPRLFAPDPVPANYTRDVGVDLTLRSPVIRTNARQINGLKPHLQEMSALYPGIQVPVEVLHGSADSIVPPSVHAVPMDGLLPNSRLTILKDTGHMPHHAEPEAVVSVIDRAVSRAGLR